MKRFILVRKLFDFQSSYDMSTNLSNQNKFMSLLDNLLRSIRIEILTILSIV